MDINIIKGQIFVKPSFGEGYWEIFDVLGRSLYLDIERADGGFWIPMTYRALISLFRYNPEACDGPFLERLSEQSEYERKRKQQLRMLQRMTMKNILAYKELLRHKRKPNLHQRIGLQWCIRSNEHALLWEMGTGKSQTAAEAFLWKKQHGLVDKCLVVCPLSLIENWENEFEANTDRLLTTPLFGNVDDMVFDFQQPYDVYVTNYDILARRKEAILPFMNDRMMVICDEISWIKNFATNRTKATIAIGERTKHKIIMSGTPVSQGAHDLFAPFLFLDCGESLGASYPRFKERFFTSEKGKLTLKPGAADEISELIYERSTRFLKMECLDLEPKTFQQRRLDMPPAMKIAYDEMVKWCLTEIEGSGEVTAPILLVKVTRLSQITSGHVKDEEGKIVRLKENPKIDECKSILQESGDQKVIIWSRFIEDLDWLSEMADELGYGYVMMRGAVKAEDRQDAVNTFNNDPKCKLFIGNPATGGVGLNLTAATLVIYFSNDYSLINRQQSEDRAHRYGQRNVVTYIDIVMKNSIDLGVLAALRDKKDVADIVTRDNLRAFLEAE